MEMNTRQMASWVLARQTQRQKVIKAMLANISMGQTTRNYYPLRLRDNQVSALLVERKLAISTVVCDQGPKSVEIFGELKKSNIQTEEDGQKHCYESRDIMEFKNRKKQSKMRNRGYNN